MSLTGTIRVPSDKSLSHRAVLFSGLASGTSHVSDVLPSDDVLSSIAAMRALGARVELVQGPHGLSGTIEGIGGSALRGEEVIEVDCGNSGTTTRLLLGILAGLGVHARLFGDASLSARPMERVLGPLRTMGARFLCEGGTLPIEVLPHGGALQCADYVSPHASAQVKSAVLLAGLFACGATRVTEPAKSRDHTELLLPAYGANVRVDGLQVEIDGPVTLHAHDLRVPADPSSAAFVAVGASLVEGSDVLIEGVSLNPTRTGAFEVMRRMGADVSYVNERMLGAEPVGDVRVRYTPELAATQVEPEEIPALIDEIPVLAVLAAAAKGQTVFHNVAELRVKESNRLAAVCEACCALGVVASERGDDLVIGGGGFSAAPDHVEVSSRHDHRLAMAWRVAQLASGTRIDVDDTDCVSISWPGFYDDFASLSA